LKHLRNLLMIPRYVTFIADKEIPSSRRVFLYRCPENRIYPGRVLSLFIPVLRTDSTRACFGRNWSAFNSPSRLAEGWRERPVRTPNFASSLRQVLLPALRKSFTRDNHPSPSCFHPSNVFSGAGPLLFQAHGGFPRIWALITGFPVVA